jgi:hypothetical protein
MAVNLKLTHAIKDRVVESFSTECLRTSDQFR